MELWIPLIGEYGFPIMVTLYLLHRLEKKLDRVTEAVENLSESYRPHMNKMNRL
ncbi:YvrJ family protein [Halalkalibacter urbisdiaboli]|uniref:YvrJ family protein n=1 Tax=Halalkalibacter urbisdiaboli TaxID=1960589 RepID=UPI000B4333CD|nr:YvrJ family protein [Halalkalibacter urbisdiaboli]